MAKTYFFKFASGNPSVNSGLSPTMIYFFNQSGTTLAAPAITEALAGSGIYKFTYTPTLGIAFTIDGATTGIANSDRYVTAALDPIQTIDQPINDSVLGLSALATGVINGLIPGYSLQVAGYSLSVLGYSNLLAGESLLLVGYSNLIMGYSNLLAGESLLLVGYSNLISGYSTEIAGYSIQIAGYSTQIAGYSTQIAGYSTIIGGISNIILSVSLTLTGSSQIMALIGSTLDSWGSSSTDPGTLYGFMKRTLEFNEGNSTYTKSSNSWQIYTRGTSLLITKTLTDTSTTTTKT